MRISDWSSDVCSSDLARLDLDVEAVVEQVLEREYLAGAQQRDAEADVQARGDLLADAEHAAAQGARLGHAGVVEADLAADLPGQQAAPGVERGGGGVELVALVARQVGGGSAEREIGQRVGAVGRRKIGRAHA